MGVDSGGTYVINRTYKGFRESFLEIGRSYRPVATISQIARELGVSISTVSAVVNRNGYVSASMRARIEKALREADYHPDEIARSLRRRETRTVGLIVPDLRNTFYAHLMRGAEDYLSSAGYRLIVADSREDWQRQKEYLGLFSGKTTDGVILVPSFATDEQIAATPALLRATPLVYVDRSPLKVQLDSVLVDNARAAYEATEHLLDLGHKRIGIITEPLNLLNAADRLRGYKRALRARGILVDAKVVRQGDNRVDSGYWCALELFKLPHRPTAVVVCNNQMTIGTLVALRDLHLGCPRDVSLIGFDDFECAGVVNPPVTMVRQPAGELGAAAAKAVLKRIRDPRREPSEHITLPTQLVVRESTAPPQGATKK
jgi:DNA-binding LacI/PurR family transcriptional regulator